MMVVIARRRVRVDLIRVAVDCWPEVFARDEAIYEFDALPLSVEVVGVAVRDDVHTVSPEPRARGDHH